jgi:hypothetical protein
LTENGVYSVRFENDERNEKLVISLVDADSGEVIRQIPPEEIMSRGRAIAEPARQPHRCPHLRVEEDSMSSVNFGGLATGMDTESIITQLMKLERKPLERLESDQTFWKSRQSAFNTLDTRLKTLLKNSRRSTPRAR